MMEKTIFDSLPDLYRHFLPDFFNQPIPNETFATCDNCAMVCHDEKKRALRTTRSFLPDKKCCTYFPHLPNYLIGALLSDGSPEISEGKKRIRKAIRNKISVTPFGIVPPKKYALLYRHNNQYASKSFGNSFYFLCPYYHKEKGQCTIWKYRERICSTYYCKTVANANGKLFWTTLSSYMGHAEQRLIEYVLFHLGFDGADIISKFADPNTRGNTDFLSVEDFDDLPPREEWYRVMWRDWLGKEEMLYKKTYTIIKALEPKEFEQISGIGQELLLHDLKSKQKDVVRIPDKLKLNPEQRHHLANGDTFPVHLKEADISFKLPKVVFEYFDSDNGVAKNHADVRHALNAKENIEIDEELILSLYQYGILIENDGKA